MSKKRNRINPDGTIEGTCTVLNEDLDKEEKGEEMDNQETNKEQENKNPAPKNGEEDKKEKEWFGPRIWKKTPTAVKIGIGAIGIGVLGFFAGCFFGGSSDDSSETPVLPDPDDEDEYDEDSYDVPDEDTDTTYEETPSADEVTVEG